MSTVSGSVSADKTRDKSRNGTGSFTKFPANAPERRVRHRISLGAGRTKDFWAATESAARKLADAHRKLLAQGIRPTADTLGGYHAQWLLEPGRSAATQERYKAQARGHLQPALGGRLMATRLIDLTPALIREAVAEWSAHGVGTATQGLLLKHLSVVLACAVRDELVLRNVASREFVKLPAHEPKAHLEPNPERLAALLLAAEQLPTEFQRARLAAVLELAGKAGLRRSEISGLRWLSVDSAGGRLHITHHAVRLATGVVLLPGTKTGVQKTRTIYVIGSVLRALARLKAASVSVLPTAFVFVSPVNDGPMDPGWLTALVKDAFAKTAWPTLSLHHLRHDRAGEVGRSGSSAADGAAMFGHSVAVHQNLYQHSGDLAAQALRDRLEAAG